MESIRSQPQRPSEVTDIFFDRLLRERQERPNSQQDSSDGLLRFPMQRQKALHLSLLAGPSSFPA